MRNLSAITCLLLCIVPAVELNAQLYDESVDGQSPPVFLACPSGEVSVSWCDTAVVQFLAVDAQTGKPSLQVRYKLLEGPGTIDSLTGVWRCQPKAERLEYGIKIIRVAAHWKNRPEQLSEPCELEFYAYDSEPHIRTRYADTVISPVGQTTRYFVQADDFDPCDTTVVTIGYVVPAVHGTLRLIEEDSRYVLEFNPTPDDSGKVFIVRLLASDGFARSAADIRLFVPPFRPSKPFSLRIEHKGDAIQGAPVLLNVTLDTVPDEFILDRFEITLRCDQNALTFRNAEPGPFINQCDWEYFVYGPGCGYDRDVPCDAGSIWVRGVRSYTYATPSPPCIPDQLPAPLFTLAFQVADDRALECQDVPVDFYWMNCHSNFMYCSPDYSLLYPRRVYDFSDSGWTELEPAVELPSRSGLPRGACSSSGSMRRADYYHGGISIACADSFVDCRFGDWWDPWPNPSYRDYLVLFSSLLQGTFAWDSVAALYCLDGNKNGRLDLQDLVCRSLMHQGTLDTGAVVSKSASYSYSDGIVSLRMDAADTLGALLVIFDGSVAVDALQPSLEVYSYPTGSTTRVLVAPRLPMISAPIMAGQVLRVNPPGILLSVEAASSRCGATVTLSPDTYTDVDDDSDGFLPSTFALHQNYPNPFNAGTVIGFDLPEASDVAIDIINLLGQVVYQYRGRYSAGNHSVPWTGVDQSGGTVASGIYYYRLTAGESVMTRKMLLLK